MNKAVKIILGVAGGWALLNGMSVATAFTSGLVLKDYFPEETACMLSDIPALNEDQSIPKADKTILRVLSKGMSFKNF